VTGTAGTGASGIAGNGGAPGEAGGGCSCETATGGSPPALTVLGLVLGVVTFARRRPRSAPKR
jgi:MYXO-CTERM domain-containing protein